VLQAPLILTPQNPGLIEFVSGYEVTLHELQERPVLLFGKLVYGKPARITLVIWAAAQKEIVPMVDRLRHEFRESCGKDLLSITSNECGPVLRCLNLFF
jgi:hypothetical protein